MRVRLGVFMLLGAVAALVSVPALAQCGVDTLRRYGIRRGLGYFQSCRRNELPGDGRTGP